MMFWIVQTWCVIGILMLLLSVLKRSCKVSPALLHALWVVVLLKSLAPQLVAWPYPLPAWESTQSNAISNVEPSPIVSSVPVPTTVAASIDNFPVTAPTAETGSVTAPATSPAIELTDADARTLQVTKSTTKFAFPTIDWDLMQRVVLGLWISGSVVVLAIEFFRIIKLNRVLRGGQSDAAVAIEVETVAKRLGIATIPHRVVQGITTPFVWSCGSPVLIWPAALSGLTAEARRGLIAHELAHVKRRDHWIAWLELASKVLWWWNPLQVALRRNLRDAADQACDAYVVNSLDVPRRLYAETLLSICEIQSQSTAPLASLAAMQNDKRGLEIRLRKLMGRTNTYRLSKLAIGVVAMLAVAILPGWSQQLPQSPNTKTSSNAAVNALPIKQDRKVAEWKLVQCAIRQEELPSGWPIPWFNAPSPESPTRSISVSGTVIDEQGRPVSNAIVSLLCYETIYGFSRTNATGEFTMDRVSVPVGYIDNVPCDLFATHADLGNGMTSVNNRQVLLGEQRLKEATYSGQKIQLVKFRELQGTVTDPAGKPVAGAEVFLTTYNPLSYHRFDDRYQIAPSTRSDSQGNFAFQKAPQIGFGRLEVRHKEWPTLLTKLYEIGSPIECKFNEGVRLRGRVEFPQNAQNPDGQVEVFSTRFGQTVDSSGHFDFLIDRRLVGKRIMLNTYAKSDNISLLFNRTPIEVSETGNDLVVGMEASRTLSGKVHIQDGKELTNWAFRWRDLESDSQSDRSREVSALDEEFQEMGYPPQGFTSIGTMDADGTYRCNIPHKAGVLSITYSYAEPYYHPTRLLLPTPTKPHEHSVTISAGITDFQVDIELPGPKPREFFVKDSQGKPISSGDLTIAWTKSQPRELSENSFTFESILQTRTVKVDDGKAAIEFPEQSIGNWIGVLAESDNGLFGWTNINEDSKSPIDIYVEKPIGRITGRTSVDKKPVANVPIQLMHYVDRGSQASVVLPPIKTTSDASGEYRFPNIAPLSGYILAGIPDGLLREGAATEIHLNPGQSLRVDDFKFLRPTGSVAGRVVTPEGAAVAGVEVHIKRSIYSSATDELYWAKDIAGVLPTALRYPPNMFMNSEGKIGSVCAAVSDADGNFAIPNLPKGSLSLYVMRFSGNGIEMPVQNVVVEVGKQDVKLVCPPPAPLKVWQTGYGEPTQLPPPYVPVPTLMPQPYGPVQGSLPAAQPLPQPK